MESAEVEKSTSSEDTSQLNRNRSFKSKQLVRSQAIRETHSPPRALSPAQHNPNPISNNNNSTSSNGDISTTNASISTPSAPISTPSASISSPNMGISSPNVGISAPTVAKSVNERTVNVSDEPSHVSVRCSDVVNSSDVKNSDSDDFKKKLPVEIQITSGGWDDSQQERMRARRWHSDVTRDLLSNNPRVCCVCGTCTACMQCRGRRRRHYCPTKQDSGISCSDDCADCSDNETGGTNNNDLIRKASSLDVDDQTYICRCPERKERPKNIMLSRTDSDDRNEPTGPELVAFIKDTLNKNVKDRMALLKIEKELHALVNDTGRCIVKFPGMNAYGRMLVHRCAALFQLSHHVDHNDRNKNSVMVTKSGTSGGRIPCTSFKEWCTVTFPPSPQRLPPEVPHAKSILKRDTNSLDEPGTGALSSNRSKSLEQREREYERVRRRIFSSQDEAQFPWLATGPIKVLTPEGGRNKLLKVQSLEGNSGSCRGGRGAVSKSHSFGGYEPTHTTPRVLSRQGDLASSSWRLSPSSSGYKTLSLRSTDSITPSPTGGASPEPSINVNIPSTSSIENTAVVWAVTDMSAVPPGACVIHPQTLQPLTNPDGSIYHFDPANPPVLYDPGEMHNDQQKFESNSEKRRGRLEKQHSFIDNDCESPPAEVCRNKCCCECSKRETTQKTTAEKETITKPSSPSYETSTQTNAQEPPKQQPQPVFSPPNNQPTFSPTKQKETFEITNQRPSYDVSSNQKSFETQRSLETANQRPSYDVSTNQRSLHDVSTNQKQENYEIAHQTHSYDATRSQKQENYELANQRPPYDVSGNQRPSYDVSTSQKQENYEISNQKPSYDVSANQKHEQYELANQRTSYDVSTNQRPPYDVSTNQKQENYEIANQRPSYEVSTNQKQFESQRSFEAANQNAGRTTKLGNEVQEVQYQPYVQGYRSDDVTSPQNQQMLNPYIQQDLSMQVMPQAKVTPMTMQDPNIRPISLTNITSMTNMVYPTPAQPYPYQYRVDPSLQMYQPVIQGEEQKVPTPHPNETAFRIDPSYPYAAVDYTSATCGACVDTNNMQQQQRSYSVPYGQVEVPQAVMQPYPVTNMILPQTHIQPYPYQEAVPWSMGGTGVGGVGGVGHKVMVPEIYPIMQYPQPYHHYNIVYPQVIPQPYPICQPVYPVIEKTQEHRRNSFSNRPSNRNSVSGSARATPHQDDKVPYEEKQRQTEIQQKIQQIKTQMAQLNTNNNNTNNVNNVNNNNANNREREKERDKKREEWRRRNSGNGLLGNCPTAGQFNGRVGVSRGASEDGHLSSAARAIVNSIRNMQARNTYQDTRREYRQDRPEFRRRDRDDNNDRPTSGITQDRYNRPNLPVYRHPYVIRQMSPGTWCRRSPGPVHHPVLNHPRRPHPDNRNPRR